MTNPIISSSSSHTLPYPQAASASPAVGRRYSYMPPWANITRKVAPIPMPPIPTSPATATTTASLSSRINATPNTSKLTTQNFPQYWQKERAPTFEKLFPKVFAKHPDCGCTKKNLLSQDFTEKYSGTLTLIDYLSDPPMQGLKNENAVFYFLDCLQLTISLSKKILPPLLSEQVGKHLQKFLFKAFLTIDSRFYPQVQEFLNLNESPAIAPAKEKILTHCKASVSLANGHTSDSDDEVLLQRNKRPRIESLLTAVSSSSNSNPSTASDSVKLFLESIKKIKIKTNLIKIIDKHNLCSAYKSYILDQFAKFVPSSSFKSVQFNELSRKNQIFNHALLFLALSEPKLFREVALTGFFEARPDTIATPLKEKSNAMKLKEEAYSLINEQAPELITGFPLHRPIWQDLPLGSTPADRLGRNPFLEQNFISVQTLLYYTGHEVRDLMATHEPNFLARLRKNPEVLSTFFNFLAYSIINKGFSNLERTDLSIKLNLLGGRGEITVYVNHDTFDLGYGNFNQRLCPNEPNLIKLLLTSAHTRWGCEVFDYLTWKRFFKSTFAQDLAVTKLIQGLADGIRVRYFSPELESSSFPFKRVFLLYNTPLLNLLEGYPMGNVGLLYEGAGNKKST